MKALTPQIPVHPPLPRVRHSRWTTVGIWLGGLAVFVNLAFPKAGIYLGALPVNFGYVLLGLAFPVILVDVLIRRRVQLQGLISALLLGLFGLWSAGSFALGGGVDATLAVIPFLIAAFVVPVMTIVVVTQVRTVISERVWKRLVVAAFLIVFIYGIVSFISINVLGKLWGVPYLTTTGGQVGDIYEKNIHRDNGYKMVSTYNNGNILGINTVMWFPLAFTFLGYWKPLAAVGRSVFLLTLSRTVWLGWLCMEVLRALYVRRSVKSVLITVLALAAIAFIVLFVVAIYFKNPTAFLLDPHLGGRSNQLMFEWHTAWQAYTGIAEIVYIGILKNFGFIGLVLFLLAWIYPLTVHNRTTEGRLAKIGMLSYLIMMLSDGAFYLSPTQFVYWMLAALVFSERIKNE